MKPVLIRQHEEMTPPGLLVDWLRERGIPFDVHPSWLGVAVPDLTNYSFMASLGSPYGPNDTHETAVVEELKLIEAAVESEIPVLGLCFGGEALSAVLGGRVERAPVPELGWREIQTDDPVAVPAGPWLEWHYERFTTPPGAMELARTADAVQAFKFGPHLGVQFHPESTVEIISHWASMDAKRLAEIGIEDGAALILSGIVGAIVGTIFAALGISGGATGGTISGLVGVLLTLLIAFFIGGYAAGRMASRQGVKHGLLVPLLALVITIVLALIGAAVGASFIDQLSGVTLPGPASKAAQQVPQQGLGTILSVSGILALLFPFIGGALGGARGARVGQRRP